MGIYFSGRAPLGWILSTTKHTYTNMGSTRGMLGIGSALPHLAVCCPCPPAWATRILPKPRHCCITLCKRETKGPYKSGDSQSLKDMGMSCVGPGSLHLPHALWLPALSGLEPAGKVSTGALLDWRQTGSLQIWKKDRLRPLVPVQNEFSSTPNSVEHNFLT